MTWLQMGWVIIGLSICLLGFLWTLFSRRKSYPVRSSPEIEAFMQAQAAAIEKGQQRQVVLGHQIWSYPFPGLGLHALAVLPSLLTPETGIDGGLTVSGGDGSLVVFARQIAKGHYQNGVSPLLVPQGAAVEIPGVTPLSFTAGLLPQFKPHLHRSLALFGSYGPEALLWTDSAHASGGDVFAAAGTIASQAVLYLTVRDLLIGEEIFLLPSMVEKSPASHAGWLAEDLLRILLMLLLVIAATLKLAGVL